MNVTMANIHTTKNIINKTLNGNFNNDMVQSVFVRLIDIIEKQQLEITQLETDIEFQANRISALNMLRGE